MSIRKLMISVVAALLTFQTFFFVSASTKIASAAEEPVQITINKNVQYQKIDGFGGFYAKVPPWYSPPVHDDAFVDLLIHDMGLTILRDEIPTTFEQQNDNNDPFVLDENNLNINGTLERNACNSSHTPLSAHFDYLRDMKAKADQEGEPLKFIASTWSPPYWMKYVKCVFGTDTNWNKLIMEEIPSTENPNDMKDEYAEWLVAYVKTVKKYTGIDVYAISIQNEPAFGQSFQSAVYTPEELRNVLKVVGNRFKQEGLATKLFGPEDVEVLERIKNYVHTIGADPEARSYMDIVAVHGYTNDGSTSGSSNVQQWTETSQLAETYNKPLWMTETSGYQPNWEGAMKLARTISTALKHGKVSGWVYWQLGEEQPSEFCLIANGVPTKLFYASKQFYRYIRPGAVQVESASADNQVLVTAFTHKEQKTMSIQLVNTSDQPKTTKLNFTGSNIPADFKVYRSSASENTADLGTVGSNDLLTLPAQSVVTLIGTAAQSDAGLSPVITTQPESIATSEGFSVNLSVNAIGTPDLAYQWKHNGMVLPGETGKQLTIKGLTEAKTGEYTVTVTNEYGSVTSQTALVTFAGFNGMQIKKTAEAPSIDGEEDSLWSQAQDAPLAKQVIGTSAAPDFAGTGKVLWDDQNLYVLIHIQDNIQTASDLVEVFLDGGNTKSTAYGADDYQFAFRADDTQPAVEYKHNATANVVYKTKKTDTGYSAEIKIPWATLAIPHSAESLVGIDLASDDGDDGVDRKAKIAWNTTNNDIWYNPSYMGTGKLMPANHIPQTSLTLESDSVIEANSEFTATVKATQANGLYAFDLGVSFNPNEVEFVGEVPTPNFQIFKRTGSGQVRLVGTLLGADTGVSGDVELVKLKFRLKGTVSQTRLTLSKSSSFSTDQGLLKKLGTDQEILIAIANADVNGDGSVQINDLSMVAKAFNKKSGEAGYQAKLDINKDGIINIVDIAYVANKLLDQ